jgi:hypothetical protein
MHLPGQVSTLSFQNIHAAGKYAIAIVERWQLL